jgi:hypothetical protein
MVDARKPTSVQLGLRIDLLAGMFRFRAEK